MWFNTLWFLEPVKFHADSNKKMNDWVTVQYVLNGSSVYQLLTKLWTDFLNCRPQLNSRCFYFSRTRFVCTVQYVLNELWTDFRNCRPQLNYGFIFQGPGLYVFNDSVFKEQDWKGIKSIYTSIKETESLKIGRFGLGFKSVFHLTGKKHFQCPEMCF